MVEGIPRMSSLLISLSKALRLLGTLNIRQHPPSVAKIFHCEWRGSQCPLVVSLDISCGLWRKWWKCNRPQL